MVPNVCHRRASWEWSATGGAEAARTALSYVKGLDGNDLHVAHRRDHELRDAVSAADGEWIAPVVDEQHHDLAAIIGVDRAGAVEQRHAMLERKSRTRTDLRLVTARQLKCEAGRHQSASARSKLHRLAYGSDQIETCSVLRVASGKRQT